MASSSESHGTHDLNAMPPASEVVGVCTCQACNRPYETDMLVPDDVWEVIKPEGCDIGGGLLCPTCIMDRAADMCGWTVGFVYPERHGTAVTAGKATPTSEVVAKLTDAEIGYRPHVVGKLFAEAIALISSLVAENERLDKQHTDDLIAARGEVSDLERLLAEAREVLEWYADRVGGVMAWSVEGAKARADLSADNGRRAYEIMEPRATLSIGGVNG